LSRNRVGRRSRYERDVKRAGQEEQLDSMLSMSSLTRRDALKRGGGGFAALSGMSLLLAACGGEEENTAQPGGAEANTELTPASIREKYGSNTIGDSWHSLQLAIIADRARGGTLAAKALGQKYQGISADLDPVKQISTVQNGFESGIKGMNTVPLAAPNVNPIDRAARAVDGMYTTSYNSPAWKTPGEYGPQYITYFAPDDRGAGRLMAENLVKHLGGKGTIVHLQGLAGATAEILRTKGVDDVLKENPGIKLGGRVHTDWTAVDAQKKMQTLLSSVGQIDGVIGADDDLGIGAYNAIRGTGKEIPIVSMDGLKQAFELTANSFYLGTVNTFTHWMGGYSTVLMFDVLNGWKPTKTESMMFWQTGFIAKDRAANYVKTFFGSTLPYDFTRMSKVLYPDDWDPQQQLRAMDPNYIWEGFDKPSGYKLPSGFDAAAIEETTARYDKQWRKRNEFST
jgi:ribose transport system substrate-binding protein